MYKKGLKLTHSVLHRECRNYLGLGLLQEKKS